LPDASAGGRGYIHAPPLGALCIQTSFSVAGIEAKRGERASGFVKLAEEVKAPMAGVVNIINFLFAKATGDPLFSICELKG